MERAVTDEVGKFIRAATPEDIKAANLRAERA